MKCILCVYSCDREPYNSWRRQLVAQAWFQTLQHDPRVETYFVFADPNLREPQLRGDQLFLPCPESYDQLALKTFAMLRYFGAREDFDYLLKLDDSCLASPTGAMLASQSLLRFCRGNYKGISSGCTSRRGTISWICQKRLSICADRFPWRVPYHGGKFYVLSREAVQTVRQYGESYALHFVEHCAGIEDVMVSVILQSHLLSIGERAALHLAAARSKLHRLIHRGTMRATTVKRRTQGRANLAHGKPRRGLPH